MPAYRMQKTRKGNKSKSNIAMSDQACHNLPSDINRLRQPAGEPAMTAAAKTASELLGGRLALDFANLGSHSAALSWEELILFLEAVRIVSPERATLLLNLPQSEPQAAAVLIEKSNRLRLTLRQIFSAMLRKERIPPERTGPINDVLRITEGHDELVFQNGAWRMEFVAREGGLDWLLAAIARSAAEILSEGSSARLRTCANPKCGLFFYDTSRTRQRRWCSMAVCGNRNKVAVFSRKHSASAERHGT
jgi:predicted RNA-binding Zn ribbon-like protein